MKVNIDEKGFKLNGDFFFPLGFNYWPRDMALYLWEEYDFRCIEREMNIISDLGANCLRIFIRWEDLNPEIGKIDSSFFPKFDDFLTHAEKYNIKVVPTLLIGHMSGQDWYPDWLLVDEDDFENSNINYQFIEGIPKGEEICAVRDIYIDKQAISNSKLQIKAVLERYRNNGTIISYDLSNENQYWMEPKNPKIGTEYVREMLSFMREVDPNHPITYGMGKPDEPSGFISIGKMGFAKYLDYYSVHVYPEFLYPMNSQIIDFYMTYRIAYECSLAELSGIPVQLQEFGLSDKFFPLIDEDIKERLIYGYFNTAFWDIILNEIRAGALMWDFCDFLPTLKNRVPYNHKEFELYFGAVDNEYKLKPSGQAMQRFSQFTQKFDISEFTAEHPKIAVILPDKFNKFPRVMAKRSLIEENTKNHSKALFSSFVFTKMCHHSLDFISLQKTDNNLENYSVLILPNLYNLSENSAKRLLSFLNSGSNKILYISSNTEIPEKIFGDIIWHTEKLRKKHMNLNLYRDDLTSIFNETIELRALRSRIIVDRKTRGLAPIYKDVNQKDFMFYKNFPHDNKAIFLCTAPEINHTGIRNSYRDEPALKIYQSIFKWANFNSNLKSDNPFVEVGILFDQDKERALLIAVNHEFKKQTCTIELSRIWPNVKEYYNLQFEIIDSKLLRFKMEPYGVNIFMLKR